MFLHEYNDIFLSSIPGQPGRPPLPPSNTMPMLSAIHTTHHHHSPMPTPNIGTFPSQPSTPLTTAPQRSPPASSPPQYTSFREAAAGGGSPHMPELYPAPQSPGYEPTYETMPPRTPTTALAGAESQRPASAGGLRPADRGLGLNLAAERGSKQRRRESSMMLMMGGSRRDTARTPFGPSALVLEDSVYE